MWKDVFDIVGCVTGLFGCIIAIVIAVRQDKQLTGLKRIGEDTKNMGLETQEIGRDTKRIGLETQQIGRDTRDTARKIEADSYRHDIVKQFFCLGKEPTPSRFKCLLPVGWHGKPLPSIHAGDYHALHVLQNMLGSETLDLSFQRSRGEERTEEFNGDAIFLCAPQANPALNEHAPAVEFEPNQSPLTCPHFDDIELPCWFADEIVAGPGGRSTRRTKKIWVCENHGRLKSPAEAEYLNCLPNRAHVSSFNLQTDYAILLRLTVHETRKIFVIAGIHQYGTWIAGEFLNRLTIESDKWILAREKNAFLQEHDVLAIVWGEFDTRTLSVKNLGIHDDCIWIRRREGWGRIHHAN
jgi:hypothetical protein